jgi:quinol-cytochrome oxidoreductase complex cytochrome b subunit
MRGYLALTDNTLAVLGNVLGLWWVVLVIGSIGALLALPWLYTSPLRKSETQPRHFFPD